MYKEGLKDGEWNFYNDDVVLVRVEAYNDDSDISISGSAIAARGAAGIRYLIEKGSIQESDILDASFFHSCKSESDFTDNNAQVIETKDNWYKIKNNSGTYSF